MYRVLIVDDETEVRNGLKLKIDWSEFGFHVAGEAKDGREAWSLLQRESFHLLIVDIRMPVMGGMELMKLCREHLPHLKIIVLSGHDDFHYVKTAIQCGARDYLLKPFVRSELKELLAKLRAELDGERKEAEERSVIHRQWRQSVEALRERLIAEWVSGEGEERPAALIRSELERVELERLLRDDVVLRCLGVEMRLPEGRLSDKTEPSGLFRLAFQLVCRETAQFPEADHTVVPFHHPSYAHMMHYLIAADSREAVEDIAQALMKRVRMNLHRYLRVETVLALGEPVQGVRHLRKAFLSSLLAWSRSQSGPVTQTVIAGSGGDGFTELAPEVEKRLELLLEDGELEPFVRTLETALNMKRIPLQGLMAFVLRVVLLLDRVARRNGLPNAEIRDWLYPETLYKFHSDKIALDYLRELAAQVTEGIRRSRTANCAGAVESVRKYVDEHYMHDLSLATLADRFHINPSYLSELFKKQTGKTFSDYLAELRLGKAAELLEDPNLRLADIAELVGFGSASYLSSAFKKRFGVSPNQYRLRDRSR